MAMSQRKQHCRKEVCFDQLGVKYSNFLYIYLKVTTLKKDKSQTEENESSSSIGVMFSARLQKPYTDH